MVVAGEFVVQILDPAAIDLLRLGRGMGDACLSGLGNRCLICHMDRTINQADGMQPPSRRYPDRSGGSDWHTWVPHSNRVFVVGVGDHAAEIENLCLKKPKLPKFPRLPRPSPPSIPSASTKANPSPFADGSITPAKAASSCFPSFATAPARYRAWPM